MDVSNVSEDPDAWEKVVLKLRAGMMPPAGRPRPDRSTNDSVATFLETALDSVAAANPNPGRSDALRRLNGTEYGNAIRDLLDLEVDVADLLPADDSSAGFDNVSLGGLDPGRMERYLTAAHKIGRLAVGAPVRSPVAETFTVPSDLNQNDHIEGLPFGTRGGTSVRHNFPEDAEYEIRVELGKSWNSNRVGGLREPHDIVITLDGEPVRVLTAEPPRRDPADQRPALLYQAASRPADADLVVRIPVEAGPRVVGAAFVGQGAALPERRRQPFLKVHITVGGDQRTQPSLYSITVTGPFDATGPGDTPSRRRIFVCRPADVSEERACAEEILSTLARGGPVGDRRRRWTSTRCSASTRKVGPRATSKPVSRWRCDGCLSARSSCSESSATRRMSRRTSRTPSQTSSLRPGSRFSSGAAFPTTS